MDKETDSCRQPCGAATDAAPNARCGCAIVDVAGLRDDLLRQAPSSLGPKAYAGLFSPYGVFLEAAQLEAMAQVARHLFRVAHQPRYVEQVLAGAPAIAAVDPGSPGGVLGLDFHLTVDGPRLIEVNTNPGGLLLNARLLDVVAQCAPSRWQPPFAAASVRERGVSAWIADLEQQADGRLHRIAIVDESPMGQYLYPEFELYAAAFRERSIETVIRGPDALRFESGRLMDGDDPIDAVYNRLTDFALESEPCAALRGAYLAGRVALSPHPRAHALFADKRNLAVLGDPAVLQGAGIPADVAADLAAVIPRTIELSDALRESLWQERAHYFFKPVAGYGSRGSYRGDKLTRRVWEAMASQPYVAQALVPPSLRIAHGGGTFKLDVRCYASADEVLLFAARLYQGQTTNMRTPGGGFAAVLSSPRR